MHPQSITLGDGSQGLLCKTHYPIKGVIDKNLDHGLLKLGFLISRLFH